ncbi:MAG: CBS domain-containing protein [Gammaproteobacteria bacterium]|nr:CBS domain-containing protein [Gammaproteobacteria bacterium]
MEEHISDQQIVEVLRQLRTFEQLDMVALESIIRCVGKESREIGDILFQAGDAYRNSLFILYKGKVKIAGSEGEKYTAEAGAVLGLSNYMDNLPYIYTATAVTPVSLLVVNGADHRELESVCPVLYNAINHLISSQIREQRLVGSPLSRSMSRPAKMAMKFPLATCSSDVTLNDAYSIMDERKIGSLLVVGEDEQLLGVVTFASLAEAVLAKGTSPHDSVMNVACETPFTVSPDAPIWKVDELQHRNSLKYVIVVEDNRPVGIISQTDILRNLLTERGGIRDEIRMAKSFKELTEFVRRVTTIAVEARERNHHASVAVRVISEFHLSIQRRCVDLTLQELEVEGVGTAPARFALIIMGSGGRKEMMLNPDQDNGIIIGGLSKNLSKGDRKWFTIFSERMNKHLDEIGYALCPGEIMASNWMFHKTLDEWQRQIDHIIEKPTKKAARWANVFLDFDTLYGDDELTRNLRGHVYELLTKNSRLLTMMVEDDAEGRPPLGLFNRLVTEREMKSKGKIDIKRNGMRILVDAVRIYALKAGIHNQNTFERLTGLVRKGELSVEYTASVRAAYEALMDTLLLHQIQQAERGKNLDKLIKPKQLSAIELETLRMAMLVIKGFQEKLQADFNTVVF